MLTTGISASPLAAQPSRSEIRKGLVGLASYAGCKQRHDGYTAERVQQIISSGITSNGWQAEAGWLRSPEGVRAVALTIDAMNRACDDFDPNSPSFVPAMQAIEAL